MTPKEVKGGVFAPADIEIIKTALSYYARQKLVDLDLDEGKKIANLLHRLNSRI